MKALQDLKVGDLLSTDDVVRLFGSDVIMAGGGWSKDRRYYITAGSHPDGVYGFRIGEIRAAPAAWNF